jgi:hypothetical protein
MENTEISFPTIGEVVREVFNCSGLLAQKEDENNSILSASDKKTLQMQLKRFADESSKIDGKLDELLVTLKKLLIKAVPNERVACMIMEFVEELLGNYKVVLKDDGTYLDKKKATQWFIKVYLLDRLVISLYKNYLRFNVVDDQLNIPDLISWVLPETNSKKTTWPLAQAWKFIYSSLSISQSAFHYPDKTKEDNKATQNLEKAQRWVSGKQLPSISSLYSNLDYSISLLGIIKDEKTHRVVNAKQVNEFKLMLFIARASTYFFKEVQSSFGDEFLLNVCQHIKGQSGRLLRINKKIGKDLDLIKANYTDLTTGKIDEINFQHVSWCWQNNAIQQEEGARLLQDYIEADAFKGFSKREAVMVHISCVGSFQTYRILEAEKFNVLDNMPTLFPVFLVKGLELKKSITSLSQAKSFEIELKDKGLEKILGWLSDWCYANFYYRNEDNENANVFYKKAFTKAKYSAGGHQYKLVNQYIESCAKNNKYHDMKKAVAWANYLGIKVRWLRGWDDPESEESLMGLFKLMGQDNFRYAQL